MALSQDELAELWAEGSPQLAAKANVEARFAIPGELVITRINGVEETRQTAPAHGAVIRNATGEEYIIGLDKFIEQYEGPDLAALYQPYVSIGTRYVMPYTGDDTFLQASWGEEQRLKRGDMLASLTPVPAGDIYCIERTAFDRGYYLVSRGAVQEIASRALNSILASVEVPPTGKGYANVKVAQPSLAAIQHIVSNLGVADVLTLSERHVTLIHDSANPPIDPMLDAPDRTYAATVLEARQLGKYAVLILDSPQLQARHYELRKLGFQSSFPDYLPHLSIKKNPLPGDLEKLEAALPEIQAALGSDGFLLSNETWEVTKH